MVKQIVITTTSFGKYDEKPLCLLKEYGFEVKLNPYGRMLKRDEVIGFCKDAIGVIAGTETLDADILERLTQSSLKVISRCGSGTDNVDMDAALKSGIKVLSTPDAPVLAVAELTVTLILNLLRKICQADRELRNNYWQKRMGYLLYGKKVGIQGFGRIGKKVAQLLKPFGCELAYADPYVEDGLLGLQRMPLEDLLSWSDIVTVHVPVSEKIIGEKEFNCMKKGVWLINTSRGGVVDESLLFKYLKSGHLAGAALDVFEQEPYDGPLKELDNVILTPHIGSYAKEARVRMEMEAVENLLEGLRACEL